MNGEPGKRPPEAKNETEPEYGDFLLVDLLHPDWKHFFSRYRVDLIGITVVAAICGFIILATKWLAMIGSQPGAGQ